LTDSAAGGVDSGAVTGPGAGAATLQGEDKQHGGGGEGLWRAGRNAAGGCDVCRVLFALARARSLDAHVLSRAFSDASSFVFPSFLGCAALCPFPDNLSLPAGVGCLGGCCVAASQAGLRGSSINGYRPVSDHAWRGRPTLLPPRSRPIYRRQLPNRRGRKEGSR